MDRTRIIQLRSLAARENARNDQTRILHLDPVVVGDQFRARFLLHYDEIRDLCESFTRPGVVAVAVDHRGVAGSLCLAAKEGEVNAAVIGRHSCCDLLLAGDRSLSLRHLVLLVHPLEDGADPRFRLLDLRTASAFLDEHGQRLESLEAEGPVFVTCGRYAIYLLPSGDSLPWPDDADDGWACVPERVYLDEARAEPDRWRRGAAEPRGEGDAVGTQGTARVTQVIRLQSLAAARRLLGESEPRRARLRSLLDDEAQALELGDTALRQGVALGRYPRCDSVEDLFRGAQADKVSRVHALVIRVGETNHVVDVGSTNGTKVNEEAVRIRALGSGDVLSLGTSEFRLRWEEG